MTERNDQTSANGASTEAEWTPCLVAGEVCGETPANPELKVGVDKRGDQNVSH